MHKYGDFIFSSTITHLVLFKLNCTFYVLTEKKYFYLGVD